VPENILFFIRQVQCKGRLKEHIAIKGVRGVISGVAMKDGTDEKGIIMVFMREDDL
jgi:hypothetical protein